MGYSTDFSGSLSITPTLSEEQIEYINTFSSTRRMKRDVNKLQELYKGKHGLNGNYGTEGEFFCFDDGQSGQKLDISIVEYNEPPSTQPELWCQWIINNEGTELEWDGGEKFYNYVEWLEYMIKSFFIPWGVVLNGEIRWQGESFNDIGTIVVTDNRVVTREVSW